MTVYQNPYGTEGTIVGNFQGLKNVASASTSSTAGAGDVTVSGSSAAQSHTLEAPVTGKQAILALTSTTTSTLARTWTLVSGTILTTASSTYGGVTLNGQNQYVNLYGLSTSQWLSVGASAAVVFA